MTIDRASISKIALGPFEFLAVSSEMSERTPEFLRVMSDAPGVLLMTAAVSIKELSVETLTNLLGRIESEIGVEEPPVRVEETVLTEHRLDSLRRYVWNWGAGGVERLSVLVAFDRGHMLVLKLNYPDGLHGSYASVVELIFDSVSLRSQSE